MFEMFSTSDAIYFSLILTVTRSKYILDYIEVCAWIIKIMKEEFEFAKTI